MTLTIIFGVLFFASVLAWAIWPRKPIVINIHSVSARDPHQWLTDMENMVRERKR